MNKEGFLKTSREIGTDKEIENMEHKGRKLAFTACSCLFIFEVIFNLIMKQESFGLCALFFTYAAAEGTSRYNFLKKKIYLIPVIVCIIAAVASLVSFILILM